MTITARHPAPDGATVRVYTYSKGAVTLSFEALAGHVAPQLKAILDDGGLRGLIKDLKQARTVGLVDEGSVQAFLAAVRHTLKHKVGN